MKLYPRAGICILTPVSQNNASLTITRQSSGKYLKRGTVVEIGDEEWSEGTFLPCPAHVGEDWIYLTYNDDVDHNTLEGQIYYYVAFGDLRAKIT